MEQYNATQIKRIIKALEDQMSSASGKTFDKMERAHRDLKDWDGTGTLPHEKMLRELNVLDGTSALEPVTTVVAEAPIKETKGAHVVHPQESVPHKQDELEVEPDSPSLEEAQEICNALRGMMEKVAQNKEQHTYFHEFALEIENWIISRRRGKLPRRDVLKQLGLWPKTVEKKETETIAPSQAEIIKPEEDSGQREIERLIAAGQLYDAVKMLERRGDAQGADKRLNSLQAQLEAQTRRLVQKARRVEKEQSADFSAQKAAWRVVQDFNPEDQEVHEALRAVEQAEIRADLKKQVKKWLETAKEAARQDNLPILNEALMETQAVLSQVKKEASWQDLQEMVGGSVQSIEKLRSETRDRLGAMATAEGLHLYREAYKATRELMERPSPPPTILNEHGEEVSLKSYWPHIRQQFVKWLQGKAAEQVTNAHETAQTSPRLARENLCAALKLLDDDVLTKDDSLILEPAKINITDDIKKIDERIAIYEKARNLVVEGQSRSLSPSQRLEHLRKAYELFPSYTGISQYIETAENDFAGELARKGNEAVNEARHLAAQDKHDDALGVLQTVSQTITTAFQRFEEGSPLQLALYALDDEKKKIQGQKRLYDNMLLLLPKVEEHIKDYDVSKNAGSLLVARVLFAEIQKSHPGHSLIQEMNAVLIQRELNIKIIELVEKSIAFLDEERYESVWEILHTIRNELIQNSNVNSLQGQLSGIEERRTTEINKTADRQENSKIKNTDPILLVLDIDESFVYSSDDPLDRNANFELAGYMVTKRPYFDEFFSKVAQWYDIAIWTGATKKYADQIIDQLISAPQKLKFVWDRKHCILKLDYDTGTYYWLKDIRKIENLGYKKERILFIEDDPRSGQRNYGNLILVKPFSGADDDKELLFLADYLESLKDIANIRKIEKRYWRNPKG